MTDDRTVRELKIERLAVVNGVLDELILQQRILTDRIGALMLERNQLRKHLECGDSPEASRHML